MNKRYSIEAPLDAITITGQEGQYHTMPVRLGEIVTIEVLYEGSHHCLANVYGKDDAPMAEVVFPKDFMQNLIPIRSN